MRRPVEGASRLYTVGAVGVTATGAAVLELEEALGGVPDALGRLPPVLEPTVGLGTPIRELVLGAYTDAGAPLREFGYGAPAPVVGEVGTEDPGTGTDCGG